jgi:hypothetical protein
MSERILHSYPWYGVRCRYEYTLEEGWWLSSDLDTASQWLRQAWGSWPRVSNSGLVVPMVKSHIPNYTLGPWWGQPGGFSGLAVVAE